MSIFWLGCAQPACIPGKRRGQNPIHPVCSSLGERGETAPKLKNRRVQHIFIFYKTDCPPSGTIKCEPLKGGRIMGYITFFQFLRRCFLMDAEEHAPPRAILKDRGEMRLETGASGAAGSDPAEQAGRSGSPGGADSGSPKQDLLPLQEDSET